MISPASGHSSVLGTGPPKLWVSGLFLLSCSVFPVASPVLLWGQPTSEILVRMNSQTLGRFCGETTFLVGQETATPPLPPPPSPAPDVRAKSDSRTILDHVLGQGEAGSCLGPCNLSVLSFYSGPGIWSYFLAVVILETVLPIGGGKASPCLAETKGKYGSESAFSSKAGLFQANFGVHQVKTANFELISFEVVMWVQK